MLAIELRNLVKSYGDNEVIKTISFDVKQGEIFALLGTNGAGKTTTLECIEGLRKYNNGTIKVNGKMGVQLQSSTLPENIKPLEALKLYSKWNNKPFNKELITRFGLEALQKKQYKELSMGQKRRLHLALALVNDPEIIFLDEPTAGLDVEGRVSLHEEIRKLKKAGKTIIMASHDMAEVESLCDRIAILKDGKIAYIGTADDLTRDVDKHRSIHVKTQDPIVASELLHSSYEGHEQEYAVYKSHNMTDAILELFEAIKKENNKVVDIKIERPTLEEQFMNIAKEGV